MDYVENGKKRHGLTVARMVRYVINCDESGKIRHGLQGELVIFVVDTKL
jgi:hypothetical protein